MAPTLSAGMTEESFIMAFAEIRSLTRTNTFPDEQGGMMYYLLIHFCEDLPQGTKLLSI